MIRRISTASRRSRTLAHPERAPGKKFIQCAVCLTFALLLCFPVIALGKVPAAEAASIGRMVSIGGWQVGAFRTSSGEYVYCVEPGAIVPMNNQRSVRVVTSLPAYSGGTFDPTGWRGTVSSGPLSGERLRQINYVLWTKGRTRSAGTAASVQLAIWILRDDPGAKRWLDHHLRWARNHGGGSYVDRAYEFAREARKKATAPSTPKPPQLVIERDPTPATPGEMVKNAQTGASAALRMESGTVTYSEGTSRLTIEGGRFADGSRQLTVDGGKAGEARWHAVVHEEGWTGRHRVEVSGEWDRSASGWPARVKLFPPLVPGQQRLAAGVGPESLSREGSVRAADGIDTQFTPVLSTRAAAPILASGEAFTDVVTLNAGEVDATGATRGSTAWPVRMGADGELEYAPVVAEGTVYGPYESPQDLAPQPPEGAPVAGRATLLATRGPGEYRVESVAPPEGGGYFYWVWTIRGHQQRPEVRETELIPEHYVFSDDFGLAEEGQVSPAQLRWNTRLERRKLTAGSRQLHDRITVSVKSGAWLRGGDGERIPARIRLTAYQSDREPAQQREVPSDAVELAHGSVEISAPGEEVVAEPILLPEGTEGWVTIQACLIEEDQDPSWRGFIAEWCDDYGIPAETARLDPPELSRTGVSGGGAARTVPMLGLGVVGTGVGALLSAGILRTRRSARRLTTPRAVPNHAADVQRPYI